MLAREVFDDIEHLFERIGSLVIERIAFVAVASRHRKPHAEGRLDVRDDLVQRSVGHRHQVVLGQHEVRSVDLRNGEVVVRSVVQGALVGLQRHQVDPCGRLKAYGTVFEDDFGLLRTFVGLHAEGGAQHAHAQFVGGHDERGGFVPRHLEEGRAGQLHVALRRAEGFGQRQFRTGVEPHMRAVVERDGRHRIARVLVNPVYVGCREEMPCRAGANGEQDGSSGPQRPPHQSAATGGSLAGDDTPDPMVGAAHERREARQVGALLEDAACPPQALQFEEVFAVLLRLLQPREKVLFLLFRSLPGKIFLYD